MDQEIFRQIWPVFSAEAREHLEGISAGILELERDPTRRGVLDGVRRIAHSLKGSSGSLGLPTWSGSRTRSRARSRGSIRRPGCRVRRCRPRSRRSTPSRRRSRRATRAARSSSTESRRCSAGSAAVPADVHAERGAPGKVRRGDDGGDRRARRRGRGRCGRRHGRARGAVEQLCAPLDPDTRRAVATGAARGRPARRARAIRRGRARAPGGEAFALLADGGPDAPRMTAALAGDLIDLREALERARR